ncbi:MAG: hypothetical protein RBR09_11225 [Desulfobulbaceae bacterium]|jgi:hypothetical protein|nr:hypothetical protein [Desulfobulbaceae bacterium]
MKWTELTMAVLVAAAALAPAPPAADRDGGARAAGQDAVPGEERSVSPAPEIPEQGRADLEAWPRPFVPTEKINADSAVSFPADI